VTSYPLSEHRAVVSSASGRSVEELTLAAAVAGELTAADIRISPATLQALSELVHSYCRACDRRDFALVRTLYHDDAIDDHGAMFRGSVDEYVAWLPGVMANFEATVHSITTTSVGGHEAVRISYSLPVKDIGVVDGIQVVVPTVDNTVYLTITGIKDPVALASIEASFTAA